MKKRFLLTMLAAFAVVAMIPFTLLAAQATTGEFDGEWVTVPTNVASVTTASGTTDYSDLATAISAAAQAENSELKLLTSVETDRYTEINSGKFTLNLNGQTWMSSDHVLWIGGTADIKITDTDGGVLKGDGSGYPAIQLCDSAKLEIAGGTVEQTNGSNAISMWNGGLTTSSELTVSGGTLKTTNTDLCIAIGAYGSLVTVTGGNIESTYSDIEYRSGIVDLSGYPDPTGITVYNTTGADVPVSDSTVKLPAGYTVFDSNGKAQSTLVFFETYTVGKAQMSPEAPRYSNIEGVFYAFACYANHNHQTTNCVFDSQYSEVGEPVKNDAGEWTVEATHKVKQNWDENINRIYAISSPEAHAPHAELPESLTVTLTWNAEREKWVYDGEPVTYDISCIEVAPELPTGSNVEGVFYAFACYTKHNHQTTTCVFNSQYSEVGEPVKNGAGEWTVEVTHKVKQNWDESINRIYANGYPEEHAPHAELPETLTVTLTWDAETEKWVYDGELVEYDISCIEAAPELPNDSNVEGVFYAFACYTQNNHQTTTCVFDSQYSEVGEPVKNGAGEWTVEVTHKVKQNWDENINRIYAIGSPEAHAPHAELPETLTVTLTWDAETEKWVYDGEPVEYEISCIEAAPEAPRYSNVEGDSFAFVCNTRNGHQTTICVFDDQYSEAGEPFKNGAGEWTVEVTHKVKAIWDEHTSEFYAGAYPEEHAPHAELPETLTVTLIWDAETEKWVYDGEPVEYDISCIEAAPELPTGSNVEGVFYAFACYTKHDHQTTTCVFDGQYSEVGEPVKNDAGEWTVEVTHKVKQNWDESINRIYAISYPEEHASHAELPETLTVTLTWDAETEKWVYDGECVEYDISCELLVCTVTVDSAIANGTVTANASTVTEGETVTLTVTPADGYELDAITVTDASGNSVTVGENNTFTMPASNVTVSATFKESGGSDAGGDSTSTNYADYACGTCGNPCDGWYPLSSPGGTADCHAPCCSVCGVARMDVMVECTLAEGTATCVNAPLCSVCNIPMSTTASPDPNAHSWSDWKYENADCHSKNCLHHCDIDVQFEDHSGGDGSCSPICEVCEAPYSNPNGEHDDADRNGKCDMCDADVPIDPDAANPAVIIIVAVSASAVAIGGAVAFVIVRKKRINT